MSKNRYLLLILFAFILMAIIRPAFAEYKIIPNQISVAKVQASLTLLEQGKQFYDVGNLVQAAEIWKKAVDIFQQMREQRNLVLSYNYLAIVYQDLGQWEAADFAITQAENLLKSINDSLVFAQVLNTKGSLLIKTGKPEAALDTWRQAEKLYRSHQDTTGIILSQINQAQALQTLGYYRRARIQLEQLNKDLSKSPDSLLKLKGLQSLGVTLQLLGDWETSQAVLSQSFAIAQRLNAHAQVGEILLQLGNTARAKDDFPAALNFYQRASEKSHHRTQVEALLNQFSLLLKIQQYQTALTLIPKIQTLTANLAPSRWGIYAQVNFAANLMRWANREQIELIGGNRELVNILLRGLKQAREIKDLKAESYALGELGHLYENNQQWTEALTLSHQALSKAQEIQADDIAVNWLWQQGRIKKAIGDINGAITAYEQAVNYLTSLRQDLVLINPDVQLSFRDEVEPIYRQLVQLLLQNVDTLDNKKKQQHLEKSRQTIEALQLAELDNFFREACLTYKPENIDKIDPSAAVIYPIILDQRLEVIVSFPGQPLQHYGTNLTADEETKIFDELRQSLNPAFLANEVLPSAQKLYDWLVRPAETEIERHQIKTLVFALDGFLRNVPPAVLHDGQQYLIQKYNLAITPGLQLLESRHLPTSKLNALVAGLADSRQGFSNLPGVKKEIEKISSYIPSQVLLNQKFTRLKVQKQIKVVPFSVVHLATHGQFSSKVQDTFLLTWDDRIQVKDFDYWLNASSSKLRERQPIELLVLSACQTAKGDNSAALGLAGIAVRSGARSTLATLWSVQDNSTAELIAQFYYYLTQKKYSKVEALRYSQLSLLNSPQYNHPYYWSAFVLVGNWL